MSAVRRFMRAALFLFVMTIGCQENPVDSHAPGRIIIEPQPDIRTARWELMECLLPGIPVGGVRTGEGRDTLENMPMTSYMITWREVPGYATPPREMRMLMPGGELRFEGVYRRPMIWIPAGYVRLGQEGIAEPVHDVWVDGFWIGKYEVTNGEFATFIAAGGYSNSAYWDPVGWEWRESNNITLPANWYSSTRHGGGVSGNEDFPVHGVSWWEADAYCRWAGLRLPTEAEWEKAAKGPSPNTPTYPWGEGISRARANYWNSGDPWDNNTTPVGFYDGRTYQGFETIDSPSPYGLYDVAGNVWEWTSTKWASYPYDADDGREDPPETFKECCRVLRGGSWVNFTADLRCANRDKLYVPHGRDAHGGFRLAGD